MPSARAVAEPLLQGMATEIGAMLEFDEGGGCILERDGGQEVSIQIDEASQSLMIYAPLIAAGHQHREALFAWLLELNLRDDSVRGAVVGMDRATDLLALRYQFSLEGASPTGLNSILADFLETVDEVLAKISEFLQDSRAESAADPAYVHPETSATDLPRGPGPDDFA